jgi:hypothetical protein
MHNVKKAGRIINAPDDKSFGLPITKPHEWGCSRRIAANVACFSWHCAFSLMIYRQALAVELIARGRIINAPLQACWFRPQPPSGGLMWFSPLALATGAGADTW